MKTNAFLTVLATAIPTLAFTFAPSFVPQSLAIAVVTSSLSQVASAYVIHPQEGTFEASYKRALQAREKDAKVSEKLTVIIDENGNNGKGKGGNRGGKNKDKGGKGGGNSSSNSTSVATNATSVDTGAASNNATGAASNSTAAAADNSTASSTGNETPADSAPLNLATIVGTGAVPTSDPPAPQTHKSNREAVRKPLFTRNLDRRMKRWAEPEMQ